MGRTDGGSSEGVNLYNAPFGPVLTLARRLICETHPFRQETLSPSLMSPGRTGERIREANSTMCLRNLTRQRDGKMRSDSTPISSPDALRYHLTGRTVA